jgi:CheY-like chemotaxis protein
MPVNHGEEATLAVGTATEIAVGNCTTFGDKPLEMLFNRQSHYSRPGRPVMAQGPGPRILVVDSDEEFRKFVSELLAGAGYRTLESSTGQGAVRSAQRSRPSLVLLDVALTDVSGYEVCHELRRLFGELLPIMFVTGTRTEPYDRVSGLLVGADDYLVKPCAPDELLARVRRAAHPLGAERRRAPIRRSHEA